MQSMQRSMQANKNIYLWQGKAPVQRLSRSKAPKTQQICHYRHTRKTSELFYCLTRASTLVSATTLLTQVPLQKFPLRFIYTIPWQTKELQINLYSFNYLLKQLLQVIFIYKYMQKLTSLSDLAVFVSSLVLALSSLNELPYLPS